jgi:2-succinyl-5-enolpyruvyl-6-hydroxy-3-cyclohexene-1-carboxylate synthase
MRTWIQLDERAAGFFALGLGRATGRPAVLVCTSGTASANYLPSVVEASHAGIPMIVCTADRPPELRGWGSPQTIDQVGLYGTAVRWSVDLPVPEEAATEAAIGWAETAVASASGSDPGPVHLNWPLREPLEPESAVPAPLVSRVDEPAETDGPPSPELAVLAEIVAGHERGVVIVGPWPGGGLHRELGWARQVRRFAAWAGWPVIGEPISHVRGNFDHGRSEDRSACMVATADHLLADEALGDELRSDVALLVGRTATTKPVRLWLERTRPRHVALIDPEDRWEQAVFRLTGHVPDPVDALGSLAAGSPPTGRDRPGGWPDTWAQLDTAARTAVEAAVDDGPVLSARISRVLCGSLPDGAVLFATNSMPVRDLDAFVYDTGSVVCCANRGAAGIDGSASTALGIAATDPSRTVALYCGDLALLHDLSGLVAAARMGVHLIAVCVDNDGGEIFSLLPVADRVPAKDFEQLFRTPHGLDLGGLDGFGGIRARRVATAEELGEVVRTAAATRKPGVDLCIVDVSRDDDVTQRRSLTEAAQQAARRVLAAAPGSR